jgi:hypothetical protein
MLDLRVVVSGARRVGGGIKGTRTLRPLERWEATRAAWSYVYCILMYAGDGSLMVVVVLDRG